MGFINSLSADFKTATFESLSQTFVSGELGPEVWTTLTTEDVVFYVGSSADSVVSERYRTEITAAILVDPVSFTTTIPDTARVTVEGNVYSIVFNDDVAYEGKVKVMGLKNYVG